MATLLQHRLIDGLEPVVRVIFAVALGNVAANVLGVGPVCCTNALCTLALVPGFLTLETANHKEKRLDSLSNASRFLLKSSCVASATGM